MPTEQISVVLTDFYELRQMGTEYLGRDPKTGIEYSFNQYQCDPPGAMHNVGKEIKILVDEFGNIQDPPQNI